MAFIARVGATSFPTEGDSVSVYETGTTTLVTDIVDLDGVALTNPITIPADGFWGFTPATRERLDVYWLEGDRNLVEKAILKDPDSPAEVGLVGILEQITSLLSADKEQRGYLSVNHDEMGFVTNGTSFSPLIEVDGSPEILWTFADGTTSTEIHPLKNYGDHAQVRLTKLKVTPWDALKIINLGFSAADGGTTANGLDLHDTQPVIDVYNLFLAAPSLAHWSACGCDINSLNFDNFVMLEELEMYGATGLEHISMKNCPLLYRFCIENCRCYDYVNFSECPSIEDIRGAANVNYHGPIFNEELGAPNLWHLCVRSNSQFDLPIPYDQMPVMRELFLWSSGHTGHIAPNTMVGTSFQLYECNFTSGDFDGCFQGGTGVLNISDNSNLVALSVANNPSLSSLTASGCALAQDQIDRILTQLVAAERNNGSVNLSGGTNGEASLLTGKPAIDALVSRGWTVSCAVEATPQAVLVASSLEFGDTGGIAAQLTVNVSNTGSLSTTPGTAILSDSTHFSIISDAVSGIALAAGETADIVIQFDGTAGIYSEALTISYESSQGVSAAPLAINLEADDTTVAANTIQFTTTSGTVDCSVVANGATVTWTFADGMVVSGADPGTHSFSSSEVRTENYVTIEPVSALTRINFNGAGCNVSEIHNLPNFPMLNYVYVYQNTDFHLADFAGLSELRQMHMNSTGMSAAEVDAMFIAVAAATPSTVSGATFYANLPRTSASDDAVAVLAAAGWVMNL